MPAWHLPRVFSVVKPNATVVVPLPPFHVIFSAIWPFLVPGGGVFGLTPVPPAFNAAGVQFENVDVATPFLSVEPSLAHETLDVSADAGVANGTASSASDATASERPRLRVDSFIPSSPSGSAHWVATIPIECRTPSDLGNRVTPVTALPYRARGGVARHVDRARRTRFGDPLAQCKGPPNGYLLDASQTHTVCGPRTQHLVRA